MKEIKLYIGIIAVLLTAMLTGCSDSIADSETYKLTFIIKAEEFHAVFRNSFIHEHGASGYLLFEVGDGYCLLYTSPFTCWIKRIR